MPAATRQLIEKPETALPRGVSRMVGALPRIAWPDNRDFAFTVFDDTDFQTLSNTPPVYDFLSQLGFRTTKTVWPLRGTQEPLVGGITCEDPRYLSWTKSLQQSGFEIALHNVTYHTSTRIETTRGFERFREYYGASPTAMANHTGCRESVYWGPDRLSGARSLVYDACTLGRNRHKYEGHIPGSPLFWGDICRESLTFVRNFVFPEINTLKACPQMPYHDAEKKFVKYWFAAAEGPAVRSYNQMLSEENQDRLEREGGAAIIYTHLAAGFYRDGRLDPRFKFLMERLSRKRGWFVPVSTLLRYLLKIKGEHTLTPSERRSLETRWLLAKIRAGRSS